MTKYFESRPMDLEAVKAVGTIAAPFTAAVVEAWVKPKLLELAKRSKRDRDLVGHGLENKFEEYLRRGFEKNAFFNSVVFNNQQMLLTDYYLPLTVQSKKKKIAIQSYPKEFIPQFKRVLLTDTAGMGKSTLLKFLFLKAVEENAGIPILIELRHLSRDISVVGAIKKELDSINEFFDESFIQDLIARGDFIFFLDGFDEIPISERESVTKLLQEFISKAGRNHFILSSRPDEALSSFSDFQEFRIQPLSIDEAFALIRKYDKDGVTADALIKALTGTVLDNVQDFLKNPLLVSLLFKSFEHKHTVPLRKPIFYRQVYDALYESHDLSKVGAFVREKQSKLDLENFHRVLRTLGFISLKAGKIEYTKDELMDFVRQARSECVGLVFSEADFVRDLKTSVPLFVQEGNHLKWSHKSIQEYFCAQFICSDTKGEQGSILIKMVRSKNFNRFHQVLDLCYDIDYKTFRHFVIKEVLSKFVSYFESSYSGINRPQSALTLRKQLTFARAYVLFGAKLLAKFEGEGFHQMREYVSKHRLIPSEYSRAGGVIWGASTIGFLEFLIGYADVASMLAEKGEPMATVLSDEPTIATDAVLGDREIGVVDDDGEAPWNSERNFCKTNEILLHRSRAVFRYEEAKITLAAIQQEVASAEERKFSDF